MTKKILIPFLLTLLISSCGTKNDENTERNNSNIENKNHKLNNFNKDEVKNDIRSLDEEGKKIVIEYFSSTDETKKQELKKEIEKHMISIQGGLSKIKGKTIEEKNKEIQKITKKIKLYRKLGF